MKRFGAVALILLGVTAKADHPPTPQDAEDALTCHVLMWVTADGAVQLAQVAESSGSSVIDGMCLNGIIIRQFKSKSPAPSSSGRWAKLVYRMEMGLPHKQAQVAQAHTPIPVPALLHPEPFDLAGYRISAAEAAPPTPVCATRAVVSADGSVERLAITVSTGSPQWDGACLKAVRALKFSAGLQAGLPVTASTDIWLNWNSSKQP
jgi:hypothetical protein